ncbi:MAG: hypothetical protein JST82_11660 [Bacteroidetes bacterium]|nr:hypothetical protein [Bacteroidota bacterium]
MEGKRKISWRRILQATVTLVMTVTCIVALLSAARLQDIEKIKGIDIVIRNEKYKFIDKDQLKAMLASDKHVDVNKMTIGKLNAHQIETLVAANPWVASSQVYVGNDKIVHINVTQRIPVARLFDQAGNSYYLDHTLKAMPLSDRYIHYTTAVTNVPLMKDDSAGNALKAQIVAVVKYIEHDSFWSAQVSQVIFTDDHTFEIVPVLGNQKILIGDTSRLSEKFDNLFAFYKKVLNRIGWDKYEVIDARYAGQVVASPALPWKAPIDQALSNMNWVKSIIGNDMPDADSVALKPSSTAVVASAKPVVKPAQAMQPQPKPTPVVPIKKDTKIIAPAKPPPKIIKPVVKPAAKKEIAKPKTVKKQQDKKEEPKPKYLYQSH